MSISAATSSEDRAARTRDYHRFLFSALNRDSAAIEALLRNALSRAQSRPAAAVAPDDLATSLAEVLVYRRRPEEAWELVKQTLAGSPHHPAALWWDARLGFQLGEPWPEAWQKLERCWRQPLPPIPPERFWDGSPLNGRSIVFIADIEAWGLGDQIQLARFAPLLRTAGADSVILSAGARVLPLLRTMTGIDGFVSASELTGPGAIPFDTTVLMTRAPGRIGVTRSSFPAAVPYLHAQPIELPRRDLNVGICWRASEDSRAVPLRLMAELGDIPGVRLFGLGEKSLIDRECHEYGITSLGSDDIEGTAGAVAALDLVVTADTMMAHLAGALARPVWTLLNQSADWRWPFHDDKSIWYPTMRLYHREGPHWEPLLKRVAADLRAL